MKTVISGSTDWNGAGHTHLDPAELNKRVGRAWMMACRELKDSHSQIHQQLSRRVLDLLGDESLSPSLECDPSVDAASQMIMQKRFENAQAKAATQIDQLKCELAMLEARLGDIYDMLEQHGGQQEVSSDPHMAALQRINQLAQGAQSPASASHMTSPTVEAADAGAPQSADPRDQDVPPNQRFLLQVAQGEKSLTEAQRQWCIAEALILTFGSQTPETLEAGGDQALAKLILSAQELEAA